MEPVTKQSLVAAHLEGKHNDRHRERCASCRDRIFIQICDCGKHPEGVGWTDSPKSACDMWGEGGFFEAKKSECTFGDGGLVTTVASRPGYLPAKKAEGGKVTCASGVEEAIVSTLTTSDPPAEPARVERTAIVQAKKAPRDPYPGKWEALAQAAGGPMSLAAKLGVSYITLRKVVRRNKSGNPDLVARVQKAAAELKVESPL